MKVAVRNRNEHDYSEEFRGVKLSIPAGGYIEMERDDAVYFLGQCNSIVRDVDGRPKPESYKKLYIEDLPAQDEKKAPKAKG
jgi:hypothetical protein